jgi:ATP-dependent DNA ligase
MGELCGVRPDGTTSFSLIQAASDAGNADALILFLFDLLQLNGEAISASPLKERKECLRALLSAASPPLQYSDHQIGRGRALRLGVRSDRLEAGPMRPRSGPMRPMRPAIAACGSRWNA